MFRPGDQIGPYVLKAQIGRGAFGVVWLAEETTRLTTHKVALKLPSEAAVNSEMIRQEAVLWEQVKGHPNILPIIKADIFDKQIYIASEYAPDGSLADWITNHRGSAPSVFDSIEMTKGILSGLAHLHSKSVIHRDLKPENILLQGETPRIADFGIARILRDSHTSQVAGTPSYMAPEGFDGIRSEKTDLWAAGVIFYQMLTGLLPYPQTDLVSIVKAVVYDEPQIDFDRVPEQLRYIVYKSLQKNAANRYQTVAVMLGDLRKINSAAFENTFTAVTVPDVKFPTSEPVTEVLKTNQIDESAENTHQQETARATGKENYKTHLMEKPPPTIAASNKSRYFIFGGGILAAVVFVGIISLAGIYLYKTTPFTPQNSNISNSENSNKSKEQENLYNRNLWAEWALMLENDEYEKIISEATDELEKNPKNIIAYRMRATAYYNLEKPEPARMDIREVLRLSANPATAEEYESRCYALKIINKPEDALENCNKAIELDSQLALAYNILGTIYHQKQNYEQAVTEYSKAIELSPRKTFYENRAIAYRAQGNNKLAVLDEKEAAALENSRKPIPQSATTPMPESSKSNIAKPKPQPTVRATPRPRPVPRKMPNSKRSDTIIDQ
ncbi:hypothetical protein BH20ACI4_BH20ACI4_14380 [soil metagenome]